MRLRFRRVKGLDHMLAAACGELHPHQHRRQSRCFSDRKRLRWKNGRIATLSAATEARLLRSLAAAKGEGRLRLLRDVESRSFRPCIDPFPIGCSSHFLSQRHSPSAQRKKYQNIRSKVPVELQQSATFNLRPAAQCKTVRIRRIWRNVVHLLSQVAGIRAGKRR